MIAAPAKKTEMARNVCCGLVLNPPVLLVIVVDTGLFCITGFGQKLAKRVSCWFSLSRSASLCCAVCIINIPGWCSNPNKQSCHGN